ncbi:hypothetical protein DLEV_085 [Diachasmimorpha longicaudata entomopoxvirus]|uniref:Uncharacterized protein n=1 Tax=Diachasmimorpha longicaudata entomopoxvirus TaxID=109981 RepID=A0A7R5WNS1_9POXV|nr:hypothetical protein QKK69_gp085 [Diachasmimorpha longicaudata entomopoxvirus]AKS26376.1 hypothetical protein DLEV_085 [Diachasmimorpha longicaudata entomopoxvirus]
MVSTQKYLKIVECKESLDYKIVYGTKDEINQQLREIRNNNEYNCCDILFTTKTHLSLVTILKKIKKVLEDTHIICYWQDKATSECLLEEFAHIKMCDLLPALRSIEYLLKTETEPEI